jgi:predicted ATPase/DNA-binding SARP family transcriptional activator/tetratricopeptide (TPR) repeat protein
MMAEVQVRLLGPFEVATVEGPQRLPGHGERALLAALALSVGRPVALTTLIDSLWQPDDLPADPLNALQVRVSKLRRWLAAIGVTGVVDRQGFGYRLQVEPNCVDVHAFRDLIETARRTGDPQQAVDLYERGLALWRGEPLVDFTGPAWAGIEAAQLDELRMAAVSERAERMLTLGRYEQVAADLEPVVFAAPTRERLVGQLMTALFNAGRQAAALDVYARTRHALTDELGLDPSRELRTIMEQILRHDPAITAAVEPPAPRAAVDVASSASAGSVVAPGNLPLRLTSFIGRENELVRCRDLLAQVRLLTLVGSGGAGKTALAIEAARSLTGNVVDGVWLVRLAAVSEPEMLIQAVADALGLSLEGGTASYLPRDVLVGRLAGRDLVILMDNCEHLIEPVASLVETLLARCPRVRVLATSREALAVPGEVQLPVAPLVVPEEGTSPDQVHGYPAARLFLDRAEGAAPARQYDEGNLAAVAEICRRLDGIPLALELAAARLTSLSVIELANHMQDRFAVLTSGTRTAEARQQTLRKTVDWSHDLLTDAQRLLFRRLAVFRGGWTLEAAEAVVAGPDLPRGSVLDVLDRLVKQSLVVADPAGEQTRYRMLETLRQYADDRLTDADEREQFAGAHAAFYVELGERAEMGLRGSSQARWVRVVREEHPNLRAALAWLITQGEADPAMRLAGSLGMYWHLGRHLEGRETLRAVMALPGGSVHSRGRAMQAVSLVERPRACIVHPSAQCAAAAADSLTIFEAAGDVPRAAFSRLLLAVEGVGAAPRVNAAALLDQADHEFEQLQDPWGRAVVAFVRMEIQLKRGDEATARETAAHAIRLFRALDDGWGLSAVLYHYGYGVQRFGAYADAVPLLEEAIQVAAAAGVYNTVQWATADLGLALLALGRIDEASACFAQAGAISDQVGDHAGRALGTYGDALMAAQDGDFARARSMFEDARAAFERLGVWLATGLALAGVADCDARLGDAGQARDEYRQLLQLAETTGEVGLLCLALEGSARSIVHDEPTEAAAMLGRAGELRHRLGRPATGSEEEASSATASTARQALGDAAYEVALSRGAALGLARDS